jgi:hypothetical protein
MAALRPLHLPDDRARVPQLFAKAIFERIRWEKDAGGDGVTCFKLNNNCTAFYARRFAKVYPEHAEFFRTREQPSAAEFPSRRPQLTPAHYQ